MSKTDSESGSYTEDEEDGEVEEEEEEPSSEEEMPEKTHNHTITIVMEDFIKWTWI